MEDAILLPQKVAFCSALFKGSLFVVHRKASYVWCGCPRREALLFKSMNIKGAGIDLGWIVVQESDFKIIFLFSWPHSVFNFVNAGGTVIN